MEALLTSKTSALCFNKDDFMVKDFSVDKFVSNCRKYVSLETMLEDFGIYHKILCTAMVELINLDYADFVNLSSNLVGLDKSIKILAAPLEKLKTEVEDMKISLNETLNSAKTKFTEYSKAYKTKVLAHHALCVLERLEKIEYLLTEEKKKGDKVPPDVLERTALDFNIVEFHLNKMSYFENIETKKVIFEKIADNLEYHLEKLFLQSLSTNDVSSLYKVLRIYGVINKERDLEKFFAKTVVKPYMECHITEENIEKFGLAKVYDHVLNFINSSAMIFEATRGGNKKKSAEIVEGYDFLVNAVWLEMVYSMELIAPVHIYAHGDPLMFHVNYTSTIRFLDKFEHYCLIQTSVKRLRKHESYERFLSKWNLDVYFEIRFSEIAGKFESSLLLHGFVYLKDVGERVKRERKDGIKRDSIYFLNASCSLSMCIKLCYDEKIFLKPLSHQFFRLHLQLVSRFYKSACAYLKCDNEEKLNPVEAAVIIQDVEMLIIEIVKFYSETICLKLDKNIIGVAFEESMKLLKDIIPLANSLMIKSLTKQCSTHLKLISDIPRLYRKTNREVPSKPSNYVSLVFKNLTDFITEIDFVLSPESKKFCLKEVTNGIIVECVIIVHDVLNAIKKMEDSLKILKRARENKVGTSGSTGMTDDDKIRQQLKIDINAFEERAKDLGLDIDYLKSFKKLKDIMNSTEKILPQNYLED